MKHDGGLYKRNGSKIWWMRYRDKEGIRRRESTLAEDWGDAQKYLRERLQARDNNTLPALRRGQNLTFGEWADFYLENFSKPPFRALKTHEVNQRALKHLRRMFENTKLAELTADEIEMYLRGRLKQRACKQGVAGGEALIRAQGFEIHRTDRRRGANIVAGRGLDHDARGRDILFRQQHADRK